MLLQRIYSCLSARHLRHFVRCKKGASLVEMSLVIILIMVIIALSLKAFSSIQRVMNFSNARNATVVAVTELVRLPKTMLEKFASDGSSIEAWTSLARKHESLEPHTSLKNPVFGPIMLKVCRKEGRFILSVIKASNKGPKPVLSEEDAEKLIESLKFLQRKCQKTGERKKMWMVEIRLMDV